MLRENRIPLFLTLPQTGRLFFFGAALLVFASLDAHAFSPQFNLEFENDLYRDSIKPSEFPVVGAGIKFNSNNESSNDDEYEYQGDLTIKMSPTHPKAYTFSSRNLYWGEKDQSYESPLRFSYGRRLIGWTKVDDLWNLGSIEPLQSWDRLRPMTQGLTGIFAYTETQKFNFRIFLSYLSLPENTPNVVIENNQFASEHPQAVTTAPQTINPLGKPVPTLYQLDIPSLSKIIFRPSFTFMMETKREIPLTAKLVYGYLPLNYFPIALVGGLSTSNSVPVELTPRLLYHQVYNVELSYRLNNSLSFGGVFLADQPMSDNLPTNLTTTPLSTSYNYSPWLQYELSYFKLVLSQLWTFGGLDADTGDFKNTNGSSLFSSRLLYRNASQVALKTELGTGNPHHPTLNIKYIHEYSILADWIAADFYYSMTPKLTLFVGGDLIGATRGVSRDRGAEFLADLRANDRVRLGATYVF